MASPLTLSTDQFKERYGDPTAPDSGVLLSLTPEEFERRYSKAAAPQAERPPAKPISLAEKSFKSFGAASAGVIGEPAAAAIDFLGGEDTAAAIRKRLGEVQAGVQREVPELAKEFEFSDLNDPSFYLTKGVSVLPALIALVGTGAGAGGVGARGALALASRLGATGKALKAAKAIGEIGTSALVSRTLEGALEASGTYNQLLNEGVDRDKAADAAAKVFRNNYALTGMDAAQYAAATLKLPPALSKGLVKWTANAIKLGVASGSEGLEELYQGYVAKSAQEYAKGMSSIDGLDAKEFWNYATRAPLWQQEEFVIGSLFGLGFQVGEGALSKFGKTEDELRQAVKRNPQEVIQTLKTQADEQRADNETREKVAQQAFGKKFDDLTDEQKQKIVDKAAEAKTAEEDARIDETLQGAEAQAEPLEEISQKVYGKSYAELPTAQRLAIKKRYQTLADKAQAKKIDDAIAEKVGLKKPKTEKPVKPARSEEARPPAVEPPPTEKASAAPVVPEVVTPKVESSPSQSTVAPSPVSARAGGEPQPSNGTQYQYSEPGEKPIYEMSVSELESALFRERAKESSAVDEVFGDRAKEYNRLQREANNRFDIGKADAAAKRINEMEAGLSEEQQDRLFGVGERGEDAETIKEYIDAQGALNFDSPKDLGESLKFSATKFDWNSDKPIEERDHKEQLAHATIRHAFEQGRVLGFDDAEVIESMMKSALKRFSDPQEAFDVFFGAKTPRSKKTEPNVKRESLSSKTAVVDKPLAEIATDTDRFQNRATDFSEKTAATVAERFDPNLFDPIVLWKDPADGKDYVLSGHSRLEGMKRRGAKNIPSRYFQGTEAEAMNFAKVEANRLGSAENLQETIKAYKQAKRGNATKSKLKDLFDGDVDFLESAQNLNESGDFLRYLGQGAATEFPYIKRFSRWVGELRKTYGEKLTDKHEQQVFDWLYKGEKRNREIEKDRFFELVEKQVSRTDFNPNAPLQLKRGESPKIGTRGRADTAKLEDELDQLRADKKNARTPAEAQAIDTEIARVESALKTLVKTQPDLFGDAAAQPAPKEETTPTHEEFDRAFETFQEVAAQQTGKPATEQSAAIAEELRARKVNPVIIDELTNPRRALKPRNPESERSATSRPERIARAAKPSPSLKPKVDAVAQANVDFRNKEAALLKAREEIMADIEARGGEVVVDTDTGAMTITLRPGKPKISEADQAMIERLRAEAAEAGAYSLATVGQGFEISVTPEKIAEAESLPKGDFKARALEFLRRNAEAKAAENVFKQAKEDARNDLVDYYLAERVAGKETPSALIGVAKDKTRVEVMARRVRSEAEPDLKIGGRDFAQEIDKEKKAARARATETGEPFIEARKSGKDKIKQAKERGAFVAEEQAGYNGTPVNKYFAGETRRLTLGNSQRYKNLDWTVDGKDITTQHYVTGRSFGTIDIDTGTITPDRQGDEKELLNLREFINYSGLKQELKLRLENLRNYPSRNVETIPQVEKEIADLESSIKNIGVEDKQKTKAKNKRTRISYLADQQEGYQPNRPGDFLLNQDAVYQEQKPYEPNYSKRPDATPRTDRLAKEAVNAIGDYRRRGRVYLANAINAEAREKGAVSLVGQTIRTSDDLAVLAQVYRDPRWETLRYVFVKDGKVVNVIGISNRLPAAAAAFPFADRQEGLQWLKQSMEKSGADGYYMLHNHPSGVSSPSRADIDLTNVISDAVSGFKGHVVIDSNEYSVIARPEIGTVTTRTISKDFGEDKLLKPSIDHPLIGREITNPSLLLGIGKSLESQSGWITLVSTNSKSRVRGIMQVEEGLLKVPGKKRSAIIRRFARQTGAASTFAIVSDDFFNKHGKALQLAVERGFIRDAVTPRGYSITENTAVYPNSAFEFGKLIESGRVLKEGEAKKQPWEMTRDEFEKFQKQKRSDLIEKWNNAGSKGFPPSTKTNTVSERIKLAEQAGYSLPRDSAEVNRIAYHRLIVEAALNRGDQVPPQVIAEYPDLKKKYEDAENTGQNLYDDELREDLGVSKEKIDAYNPEKSTSKSRRGWTFTTMEGNDYPGLFDTKKEAVESAKAHKELKQDQFENPSRYRDITSVHAEKRLRLIEKYEKEGLSEYDAGQRARKEIPDVSTGKYEIYKSTTEGAQESPAVVREQESTYGKANLNRDQFLDLGKMVNDFLQSKEQVAKLSKEERDDFALILDALKDYKALSEKAGLSPSENTLLKYALKDIDSPEGKRVIEKVQTALREQKPIEAGALDKIAEWTASMYLWRLSSVSTSLASNIFRQILKYGELKLAAWFNNGIARIVRVERTRYSEEAARDFQDAWTAEEIKKGISKAIDIMLEKPGAIDESKFFTREQIKMRAIGGKKGTIIRAGLNAQAAIDVLFRKPSETAAISRYAFREAGKTSKNRVEQAKKANDIAQNVRRLKELKDAKKEVPEYLEKFEPILAKAEADAEAQTFQSELEGFLKHVSEIRRYPLARIFVPFFNTRMNILLQAYARTPLSAFGSEFRDLGAKYLKKSLTAEEAGRLSDRMAQITLGTAVFIATTAALYGLSDDDEELITGDFDEKTIGDKPAGWLPNAVRVGGTYVSMKGFEPYATIFTAFGNAASGKKSGIRNAGEALAKAAFSNPMTDELFDIMGSLKDGNADKFFVEMVAGAATPGLLQDISKIADPTIRQKEGLEDRFKSRVGIPGLSTTLPERVDVFGEGLEPQTSGEKALKAITGVSISSGKEDAARREIRKLGLKHNLQTITHKGVDLEPWEVLAINKSIGEQYRQTVLRLLQNPTYLSADNEARKAKLRSVRKALIAKQKAIIERNPYFMARERVADAQKEARGRVKEQLAE